MSDLTKEQKNNIRKWVQALRNGKYKGATGQLCKEFENGVKRYCCLGVACEIGNIKYNYDSAYPPSAKFVDVYGLHFEDQETLANMNDNKQGWKRISTYIENRWLNPKETKSK